MNDSEQRTQTCNRDRTPSSSTTVKGSKQICIPMEPQLYKEIWHNASAVRKFVDQLIR